MTDTPTYRLGIVGCGTISAVHAQAIRSNERAVLVAAYSRTEEKLGAFCDTFDLVGYTDYSEFLASDLDMVVLCTPNGTHLDFGLQAADAGKHLIIEKPLEITVGRGKQLVEHCRQCGVSLAVIYQNRFIDNVRRMKKAVDQGKLGRLVMVRTSVKWFRDQNYYRNAPWRGSLKLDGGGALINQSIHTIDLMLWLAGPVRSVQAFKATLTHEGMEGEDNLVASMQFENGALGVLEASTSIVPPQNRKIELHGSKGSAILDGDELHISISDAAGNVSMADAISEKAAAAKQSGKPVGASSGGASSPLGGFSNSHHTEQYRQIFECLDADTPPPVCGEESLNSLAFVQAAYMSASQNIPVSPDSLYPYYTSRGDISKK
jgi:UDP-N-acetyl-2-amino-2-deoxyglucuronate dehydrogenase